MRKINPESRILGQLIHASMMWSSRVIICRVDALWWSWKKTYISLGWFQSQIKIFTLKIFNLHCYFIRQRTKNGFIDSIFSVISYFWLLNHTRFITHGFLGVRGKCKWFNIYHNYLKLWYISPLDQNNGTLWTPIMDVYSRGHKFNWTIEPFPDCKREETPKHDLKTVNLISIQYFSSINLNDTIDNL